MIPIRKWFRRKAFIPAIGGIAAIILIQVGFYTFLITTKDKQLESSLTRLSTIVQLGILQKNRVLLESAIDVGINDLGARQVALCNGEEVLLSYPQMLASCHLKNKNSFLGNRLIEVSLPGLSGYQIVYEIPKLLSEYLISPILSVNCILIVLLIFILMRLNRNIHDDILTPLRFGLSGAKAFLIAELEDVRKRNIEFQVMREREEVSKALLLQSAQVAHDIRSPLAALDMALRTLPQLPEDNRLLVRGSIERIRDIANNLLQKNHPHSERSSENTKQSLLISSLIGGLVSEKRMQFRSKLGIEIDLQMNERAYGIFSKINATEFKRMLSNLVNNAVEVLGDAGHVKVTLGHSDSNAIIAVTDDGRGIPPEILSRLGQRGETHGKEGGSGLGLYHARTTVESWGGRLEIDSTVGFGTTVMIKLPLAQAPAWFVEKLKIESASKVVILDDDSSVHRIWDGRFASARLQESGIEVLHFSTPVQCKEWVQAYSAQNVLFLVDYELLGFSETGLDLIEVLGIQDRSILVTSRFEEPQIRARCERLKVRLIPKAMAAYVPIEIEAAKVRL